MTAHNKQKRGETTRTKTEQPTQRRGNSPEKLQSPEKRRRRIKGSTEKNEAREITSMLCIAS